MIEKSVFTSHAQYTLSGFVLDFEAWCFVELWRLNLGRELRLEFGLDFEAEVLYRI